MFKKISLALLVVLLAATTAVVLVSAEDQPADEQLPPTHPRPRGLVGQILSVGEDQFDIESPNGETHTITVSDETAFRSRQEGEETQLRFQDLDAGMWVAVFQPVEDSEFLDARLVVLLPDDFNPDNLRGRKVAGEIEKVNPGQQTFEITTRNGEPLSLQVDDQTRFAGELNRFDDLEKGVKVAVLAVQQEDGTLLAKFVGARNQDRPHLQRTGGKITQLGEDSLTILSQQGEEYTFTVTDETRFGSRNGDIQGIEDLELDMPVLVISKLDDLTAMRILVADPALLSLERVPGTVQSAGGSHLTINVEDEKMQFTVDENTRIKGRGIDDLNDLKNGMKVLVLYEEIDGEYLAKGIIAGPHPPHP